MSPRVEHDPTWIAQNLMRQQQDINRAQHTADNALHQAALGVQAHTSHEEICSLRYTTITKDMESMSLKFGTVFSKLDKLAVLVYIGVGIWVGIPVVAGAIFGIIRLIGIIKGVGP